MKVNRVEAAVGQTAVSAFRGAWGARCTVRLPEMGGFPEAVRRARCPQRAAARSGPLREERIAASLRSWQ